MEMPKPGDVFHFSYFEPKDSFGRDLDWCFDGQLVACGEGERMRLIDTYWRWPDEPGWSSNGRELTVKQAQEQGTLTFVCNLADVEPVREWNVEYYAPEDVFDLSHQHGCYKRLMLRKGAQRNQSQMAAVLRQKIDKAKSDAAWELERAERFAEALAKVEAGDLDVWF